MGLFFKVLQITSFIPFRLSITFTLFGKKEVSHRFIDNGNSLIKVKVRDYIIVLAIYFIIVYLEHPTYVYPIFLM